MALLVAGWGGNWPATKIALLEFDPALQRACALFFGGLGLLALTALSGRSIRLSPRDLKPFLLMAFFQVTLWHVACVYGVSLMPAGRASIIANLVPLWVAVLGFFFLREPFTPCRSLGLVLGLCGLGALAFGHVQMSQMSPWGPLLMLLASFSAGCAAIVMKAFDWHTPALPLTGWAVFIGGIPVYIIAYLLHPKFGTGGPSLWPVAGLVYTTVMAIIFCHWCWFTIVRLLPVPVAASSMFGVPVVGVVASGLLLHETVGLAEILALALTSASIFMILWGDRLFPGERRAPK